MGMLMTFLVYVGGALEASAFLVVFLAYALWYRRFSWDLVPRALKSTALLFLAISLLRILDGNIYPLLWLTYAAIALAARAMERGGRWGKCLAVPVAATIFTLAQWQFTEVKRMRTLSATWDIDARGRAGSGNPEESLVNFHFAANQGLSTFSDPLARYLKSRGAPKVDVTLILYYDWAHFAGSTIELVDGKTFQARGGGGSLRCAEICQRTYFGIRGISYGN